MENNNPPITLTLDLNRVNLLLSALSEMPFRVSVDLIGEIQKQSQEQIKQPELTLKK